MVSMETADMHTPSSWRPKIVGTGEEGSSINPGVWENFEEGGGLWYAVVVTKRLGLARRPAPMPVDMPTAKSPR